MIFIEQKNNRDIPGETSFFIKFDYNPILVETLKSLQEYSYNTKTFEWEVSKLSLFEIVKKLSRFDEITINLLNCRADPTDNLPTLQYKLPVFDHQYDGIKYGLNHDKWLLLDKPGLGKTSQIIHIAEELKEKENLEHCLVICGVNMLKINWENEIQKHSNLSSIVIGKHIAKTGNVTYTSIQKRAEQLKNKIDEFFIIINIESMRDNKIIEAIQKGANKIDMAVIDEIHMLKSPNSQQTKNVLKLKDIKYKIGATGTLILNNPLDSYIPLKWIEAEHTCFSKFRNYYCVFGGNFNNEIIGFKNLDLLKDTINEHSLRRDKSLLNLPEKIIIDDYVEMDSTQENFYNDVVNKIKTDIDKINLDNSTTLSLVTRLRQATACPHILSSSNIPSAKLERCADLIHEIISGNDSIVVFSTFKETLNELSQLIQDVPHTINTGDTREDILEKNKYNFQNSEKASVFLGTWQKCGTGITLNRATYMIFIDTPWTYAAYEQSCDRIHRIGTTKSVTIYNLITANTIDTKVKSILDSKEAIGDYLVDDVLNSQNIEILRKYIKELTL